MRFVWLAVIIPVFCVAAAQAQFRWVDADGNVGYGDKPPPGAQFIDSLEDVVKGAPQDPQTRLPYHLQRTIKDFPVTLYTMSECAPCDSGRSLLKGRAVPFTERTVRTADDVQALKKLTGGDQMPAIQVGAQMMTGFNSATWNEALDLAGYPRARELPADWVWPAPKPLTEPKAEPDGTTPTATPAATNAQPY